MSRDKEAVGDHVAVIYRCGCEYHALVLSEQEGVERNATAASVLCPACRKKITTAEALHSMTEALCSTLKEGLGQVADAVRELAEAVKERTP